MKKYPKIYGPYNRRTEGPDRNKLIMGAWSRPEFEALQNCLWEFTEQIDGTNIRVHWDGHKVIYGGRTDNAQIPAKLVQALDEMFPEELFEQTFEGTPATLYGEGYGAGIQKGGGNYRPDQSFILFDVLVGGWWLTLSSVDEVARRMGLSTAPYVFVGTLLEGINNVRENRGSFFGDFEREGLVGVPRAGFLDRAGNRIMVKIKSKDFPADVPL